MTSEQPVPLLFLHHRSTHGFQNDSPLDTRAKAHASKQGHLRSNRPKNFRFVSCFSGAGAGGGRVSDIAKTSTAIKSSGRPRNSNCSLHRQLKTHDHKLQTELSSRSAPHSAIGSSTPELELPGPRLAHLDLYEVPCQGDDTSTSGASTCYDPVPETSHDCPEHLSPVSSEGQDLGIVDATKPGAVASDAIRTATPISSPQSAPDSSTPAPTSQPLVQRSPCYHFSRGGFGDPDDNVR
ncbi:hypothetical protein BGZ61DRAFT_488124 [Ilyonectria robusta]|uniref:uncharacterized protein n=1 Tax=Ilyonectria robusta TaxID=1079257 RepID=UPI001E8D83DE|nr:uncharacterized protein BGZ61DRAFT_488124 [Ilyonectria robusta]KAH8648099.1 hypothetical protein BGZ61DRAFT_488124 [Ilyonectria robusta]